MRHDGESDVQDFGEHLIEVREQLEVPLPVRVPFWRLLAAVAIEGFSSTTIYLLHRGWRSCVQDRCGLVSPNHDLDDVLARFRELNGHSASREQIEQAEEAFKEQLQRRFNRFNHEIKLWVTAVNRGLFIGTLLMSLTLVSMMMCLFTGRIFAVWVIMVSVAILQLLGAFICLQGWHRP